MVLFIKQILGDACSNKKQNIFLHGLKIDCNIFTKPYLEYGKNCSTAKKFQLEMLWP